MGDLVLFQGLFSAALNSPRLCQHLELENDGNSACADCKGMEHMMVSFSLTSYNHLYIYSLTILLQKTSFLPFWG